MSADTDSFQEDALRDVVAELRRQVEKFGADGTCASPSMLDVERLAILTEELGEVAECVIEARWPRGTTVEDARYFMRAELIQVAAVAVAWVEGLDREARA